MSHKKKPGSSKSKAANKTGRPSAPGATRTGTLDVTRSGMGYVVVADASGDVLVRPPAISIRRSTAIPLP